MIEGALKNKLLCRHRLKKIFELSAVSNVRQTGNSGARPRQSRSESLTLKAMMQHRKVVTDTVTRSEESYCFYIVTRT